MNSEPSAKTGNWNVDQVVDEKLDNFLDLLAELLYAEWEMETRAKQEEAQRAQGAVNVEQ